MGESTNIMLVEDHALFRQALAVLLDGEPDLRVVVQAGSLTEARERLAALKDLVHVAVVDFALPDGDATGFVSELCQASPGMKVMVLTASVDPQTSTRASEAGASAALHKTARKDEILSTLRSLLEGE